MKKTLSLFALIALTSSAFADIPPPSGFTVSADLQGAAASIVMEHITNGTSSRAIPALIGSLPHGDGSLITGPSTDTTVAVSEQSLSDSDSAIACAKYYYRHSRSTICKLVKRYK